MKKIRTFTYKVKDNTFEKEDFEKDCPDSLFIPTTLPSVKRIIAIGDIHGDYLLALRSFEIAGLINSQLEWIGGKTIVVQVGDQIDSCRQIPQINECHYREYSNDKPDDLKIINFFNLMDEKAREHGGAVYSLLGNHELMNVEGIYDYVSYNNMKNRELAFAPGGKVRNILACQRSSVLVIGSNMFVHAGILPVLANRLEHLNIDNEHKLKYLNKIVRKWLLNKVLSKQENQDRLTITDDFEISPFWTRIYGMIPNKKNINSKECQEIKSALEVYKVGQIVVGHTPQLLTHKHGIEGTCYTTDNQNKLYKVDGGFADSFNIFANHNLVQVLEIIDDNQFNIISGKKLF